MGETLTLVRLKVTEVESLAQSTLVPGTCLISPHTLPFGFSVMLNKPLISLSHTRGKGTFPFFFPGTFTVHIQVPGL